MLKLPTESFDCLSSFGGITYGIKSRQSLDVGLHQLFFDEGLHEYFILLLCTRLFPSIVFEDFY